MNYVYTMYVCIWYNKNFSRTKSNRTICSETIKLIDKNQVKYYFSACCIIHLVNYEQKRKKNHFKAKIKNKKIFQGSRRVNRIIQREKKLIDSRIGSSSRNWSKRKKFWKWDFILSQYTIMLISAEFFFVSCCCCDYHIYIKRLWWWWSSSLLIKCQKKTKKSQ